MSPLEDLQAQAAALLTQTLEALGSVHARDLEIRHDSRPPA